jgi:hypothetical protein
MLGCSTHGFMGRPPASCKVTVDPVAAPGRYQVAITPPYQATMSGRLIASEILTGSFSSGAVAIGPMRKGQVGRYTFSGTAGVPTGLNIAVDGFAGSALMMIRILQPDGKPLNGRAIVKDGAVMLDPMPLPVSGTYTVSVDTETVTLASARISSVAGPVQSK